MGNPKQDLDVIYDTGSSLTWVNSAWCDLEGCKNADYMFDHTKSTSYETYNNDPDRNISDLPEHIRTVTFSFGSGDITAKYSEEDTWLDGILLRNSSIFEIVSYEGQVFEGGEFDGIVGLGLQTTLFKPIF